MLNEKKDKLESEDTPASDRNAVVFVMDSMRAALLTIAEVPFSDTNRNMCLSMRAIARGTLRECAEALKNHGGGGGGLPVKNGDGIIPLKKDMQ